MRIVPVTDNVVLDFSGLFEQNDKEALKSPIERLSGDCAVNTTNKPESPLKGQINALEREQAKQLFLQVSQEQEDHRKILEVYKTYQENIQVSSQIQTAILKGVKAGEDVYSLFLKAVQAISLMTGNTVFYKQICNDIKAIYGDGLLTPKPLEIELRETETRLRKLRESYQRRTETEDSLKRIGSAIQEHEKRISELKRNIATAQNGESLTA